MNIPYNLRKLVYLLLGGTSILLYSVSLVSAIHLFWTCVIVNLLLVIESRRSKPIALLFLFLFTYSFNLYSYYINNIDISGGYNQFDKSSLYDFTLYCHTIFCFTLLFFLPRIKITGLLLRDNLKRRKNKFLYWVTLSIMIFMLIFGVTGENIIQSGGYTKGETSSLFGLSLNEYYIIFLPIAYRYAGKVNWRNFLIIMVSVFFCLKVFLFGGRIGALQCMLMIYILYIDSEKISLLKLLLLVSPFIYLFILYGTIRSNPFIVLESPYEIAMSPFNKASLHHTLGNQNDVFYSSVRLVGLIEEGYISMTDRVTSMFSNILAVVTPYKFLPDIANLAGFMKKQFPAGGGALLSTYYYVFFSYPGLIFLAYYLASVLKKVLKSKNQYWVMYGFMILVTFPRWVGYNPISIFKMSFYIIPTLLVLNWTYRVIKK